MIALFQKSIALGIVGISLAACSPEAYTPEKAIAAAAADPTGVVGKFEMTVQRVGRQNNMVYLDSADNYRDPKTLIIGIYESTVNDLLQGTSDRRAIFHASSRSGFRSGQKSFNRPA